MWNVKTPESSFLNPVARLIVLHLTLCSWSASPFGYDDQDLVVAYSMWWPNV